MSRSHALLAAPALAIAVAVAGCGGSSKSSGGNATSSAAPPKGAGLTTIATSSTRLGRILVDGQGRTLYLFLKDHGPASTCSGACAGAWPPVTTSGRPRPGAGVAAAMLGTTRRADGATEVTYAGHPLYTYAGDSARGQTNGEGLNQFGAEWYVLSASGRKVEAGGS